MWIKTGDGSLLNLEKCRDLHVESAAAAYRLVAVVVDGEERAVVVAEGLTEEQANRARRDLSVLLQAVEVDDAGAVVRARR